MGLLLSSAPCSFTTGPHGCWTRLLLRETDTTCEGDHGCTPEVDAHLGKEPQTAIRTAPGEQPSGSQAQSEPRKTYISPTLSFRTAASFVRRIRERISSTNPSSSSLSRRSPSPIDQHWTHGYRSYQRNERRRDSAVTNTTVSGRRCAGDTFHFSHAPEIENVSFRAPRLDANCPSTRGQRHKRSHTSAKSAGVTLLHTWAFVSPRTRLVLRSPTPRKISVMEVSCYGGPRLARNPCGDTWRGLRIPGASLPGDGHGPCIRKSCGGVRCPPGS